MTNPYKEDPSWKSHSERPAWAWDEGYEAGHAAGAAEVAALRADESEAEERRLSDLVVTQALRWHIDGVEPSDLHDACRALAAFRKEKGTR